MTRPKKKRRDYLKVPAHILLVASLILLGSDIVHSLMSRRRIANQINQAVSLSNHGEYKLAGDMLVSARREWEDLQHNLSSQKLIQHFLPFNPQFDSRFARIHKGLGIWYTENNRQHLAVKHYTLAMLYDMELQGVPDELASLCLTRGLTNYRLGLVTSRIAYENTGKKVAKKRLEHFKKKLSENRD